jgi:hypothetical protein
MIRNRPVLEVSVTLEQAAVAFERCLQALARGSASVHRQAPRPAAEAVTEGS